MLAIRQVLPVKFGNMKVAFDVTLVALSILIGLVALGRVEGVREGTVAAALCVGLACQAVQQAGGLVRAALSAVTKEIPRRESGFPAAVLLCPAAKNRGIFCGICHCIPCGG